MKQGADLDGFPHRNSHPPFWRLLISDFDRFLTQAFLIGLCLSLLGLTLLAWQWLSESLMHMGDKFLIVVTLPSQMPEEEQQALRGELANRTVITEFQEFGPGNAAALLQAAGLDEAEFDPALLVGQPRGFSFSWRGLAADQENFLTFRQALLSRPGLQVAYDQDRVRVMQTTYEETQSLFRRFTLYGWGLAVLAVALVSLMIGRPRLGARLGAGEMAQVLFVRGLLAGLVAWIAAGAVLQMIGQHVGASGADAAWWPLLAAIPLAGVVGLLALLPGLTSREIAR